jgi:hypothetical protein
MMKTHGAFLVPTLSTYAALADEGERLVVDGDPTRDAAVLTQPEAAIALLMQGGRTLRSRLVARA